MHARVAGGDHGDTAPPPRRLDSLRTFPFRRTYACFLKQSEKRATTDTARKEKAAAVALAPEVKACVTTSPATHSAVVVDTRSSCSWLLHLET
jgi:hypothetical protein